MTTLKSSEGFRSVYQKGRWLHGKMLSLGWVNNGKSETRLGIRTRKGIKQAVERNRLKRQLRAAIRASQLQVRQSVDIVCVVRQKETETVTTRALTAEFKQLCSRAQLISLAR